MTDFYELLEVPTSATEKEIKQSYRRLSLINHPDRNPSPDAHEKFKKINEAYETLGDGEKKSRYDMMQKGGFPGDGFPGNGFPPGFPGFAGFQFGGGGNGGIRVHHGGGIPPDINSIFENLFNMQHMQQQQHQQHMHMQQQQQQQQHMHPNIRVFHNGAPVTQKPPPVVKKIDITLEQAYEGFMIKLELERRVFVQGVEQVEAETIPIQINKGVDHGECIVLNEMGNRSPHNTKGDIHIIVEIKKHDLFTRDGLDLCCKKTISLKDALCGFAVDIPHLNGKMLRLTNQNQSPSYIIKPGYKKEIPTYGMEKHNEKGKLILEFEVEFPLSLTDEQKQALKSLL